MKEQVKKIWRMFWAFFKIGAMTFGGGYAMLPMIQREIVEKGYATDEEVVDCYAISQCTPGVIAVNTATFIGSKYAGILGGIFATMGVCLPGSTIIIIIARLVSNFSELKAVNDAFSGIRVCVCILILNAVLKLFKSSVKDRYAFLIFLAVFVLSGFLDVSSIILVASAAVCGLLVKGWGAKQK